MSQYNLAYLYSEGRGVQKSRSSAYLWLSIAEANGYGPAVKMRKFFEGKMNSEEVSEMRRLVLICLDSAYKDCGGSS